MSKRRRRGKYKFTEKTISKRGICSLVLESVSFIGMIVFIVRATNAAGTLSVYAGVFAICFLLLAITGLVFAIHALAEEETFRGIPVAGLIYAILICLLWVGIYILGI